MGAGLSWAAFTAPAVATGGGFWTAALAWASVFLLLWAVAFGGLALVGFGPLICGLPRRTWALKAAMLVHHVLVGPLALCALLADADVLAALCCFGCEGSAWALVRSTGGPSLAAQALMPVTVGYMVADLVLLPAWSLSKGSKVENILMVLHHSISLGVWPPTLLYDYCSRYVLILLSYEVSSIFLVVNWLLSSAGKKDGAVYKVSGLLFTASFVIVRMLGALPQLRALCLVSPWTQRVATAVAPGELAWWQVVFTSTLLLPHLLNLFWGVKVIRGFCAVLRTRPVGAKESQGKHGNVPLLESDGK